MSYNYFAFVSYSRKDKAAARYLQNRLESYRYPSVLVDDAHKPENPKYLRKIFRDTSDLDVTQSNFTESIDRCIAESRYLVVLCSPNSQKSVWVDREIGRFLETHDDDLERIFPIILEGDVPDCLPERLRLPVFFNRNIPTMIPDDASSQKDGWEHGFLQLVGCLLNVSIDKITDRFQKAKQAKLRRIIFGTAVALAVTISLTVWALIAEQKARKAEAEARHEAEVAKQTLAFIENAFESADAMRSGDKNMTVLQFAKMSSRHIRGDLNPEVRWGISRLIAPLLNNMGDPVAAQQLLESAESTVKSLYPENSPAYADYLAMRGKAYGFNAVYEQAKTDLTGALAVRTKAADQLTLAEIWYRTGDYRKSLEFCEQARNNAGDDKLVLASALSCAGKDYRALHDYRKAFEFYSASHRLKAELFGAEHPQVAETLNDLGNLCLEEKHFGQALEYYSQALKINEKRLGTNHPQTAKIYNNIGIVFRNQKRYARALEYYQKSLDSKVALLGAVHPEIAQTCNNIAILHQLSKDFDQARKYYERALGIYVERLGVDHADTARVRVNLAQMLRICGQTDEALAQLLKADTAYTKNFGAEYRDAPTVCCSIGGIYAKRGAEDEALRYFRRARKAAGSGNHYP